jgi:DNA-binding LacI/PurR family transcriptional regulator/C4-dicarboxylate-specific signal transduction histidine kinase
VHDRPVSLVFDGPPGSGAQPRLTIGFLVDTLFDAYEEAIWNGVMSAASELDTNVLAFVGGAFAERRVGQNGVFDLIHPDNVDGLVTLSASIGNLISSEELVQRFRQFGSIPLVSVSKRMPGVPNVLLDNETGLRAVLDHLVVDHGRRRIAFIRGPVTNDEAEIRYRVYRERLAAHGLPFLPELVYDGDFDRITGMHAVRTLLDERRVRFDALVGANDYMALYAMQELKHRGVRVPEDVAVAGFDDIADAAGASPPLTTVRQPFERMGSEAVRTLVAALRGERVAEVSTISALPILRGSCGCGPEDAPQRGRTAAPGRPGALAARLRELFPGLAAELHHEPWADELAGAVEESARAGAATPLEAELERLVGLGLSNGAAASRWYPVLAAAFELLGEAAPSSAGGTLAALHRAALVRVGSTAERRLTEQKARADEEFKILRRVFMPSDLSESEVKQVLLAELPSLGVRGFFLSRYTDPTREHASLFIHYDFGDAVALDRDTSAFPARQLVPGRFAPGRRHAFAVLPVFTRRERLGFALCQLGSVRTPAYEALTYQISAAVKVTELLSEVRGHAAALEVKVAERTQELRATQQQLVDAAHQAGMAEIAIGLMHNVGNLLTSVNVSAETIASIAGRTRLDGLEKANALLRANAADLASFLAQDPRGALLGEYYDKVAGELRQERERILGEVRLLLDSGQLIRETIKTLQEHAGDGRYGLREQVDVLALVESALKLQEPNLLQHRITVERDLKPLPPLTTERAKVIHVLVNVVKNAVEAMEGRLDSPRRLSVRAWSPGPERAVLEIADTGVGIAPRDRDRIFSYGFTTKPYGHGFGLHTCANFMTQLGGRISVASDGPATGATFTLEFGVRSEAAPPGTR